jgi:hypothetical protein
MNSSAALIANSTFNRNESRRTGGALLNRAGTMQILGVTLAENAGKGGNLFNRTGATAIVANTIFANGIRGNCRGELQFEGGNLRWPTSDPSCAGEYGDPMLDILRRNGGFTQTMALETGSNAINRGLRENCLRVPVNNMDQRGVLRIVGSEPRCDSGAFESEQ